MKWLRQLWSALFCEGALLRAENKRLEETCMALEEENAALRVDLRAAVNNVLMEAGAAALPSIESRKPADKKLTHRRPSWQQRQRLYAFNTKPIAKEAAE